MPTANPSSNNNDSRLSLDTWAVIVALLLTLAVKIGVFNRVPW